MLATFPKMGKSSYAALIGGPQVVNLALNLVNKAIQLGLLPTKTSFQSSRGDTSVLGMDVLSQCIWY